MFLHRPTPIKVLGWAWDETPSLRPRYAGSGLMITATSQVLAVYVGKTPVAEAMDGVLWLLAAWLVISFLWFVINLFRAPKALYQDQQERAQQEFNNQTMLNNQ
jgi:hypothetical protein